MVSRDIKVGIFVAASLSVLVGLVFLIGSEASLFSPHTEMKTAFHDVQGLARGSPVRMGGVDIGRVTEVGYTPDAKSSSIVVKMLILEDQRVRIRSDSVASIGGRGMLGDKMITITVGSPNQPVMPSSELIPSEESQDFLAIISNLKSVAAGAEKVVNNLEKATATLAEEDFRGDIKESVDHLNGILGSLESTDGYMGRLLHDPKEADNLSQTVTNFRKSAAELELVLRSTRTLIEQAKTGPGLVHELLYGQDSEKAVAQFGGAAEELGLALRGVREGDSFAHSLLYDKKSAEMVDNLNQASADFRDIARDVRLGKGTVGALLSDPSVYEDLKLLLGNVGRNRSLRALVRYSIHQDESAGRVESSPEPAQASQEGSSSSMADLK
jgi:phospholipid/cholesterol/gamma-HCH transport system substrate-binding protein